MKKRLILIFFLLSFSLSSWSQCTIPNAQLDSFVVETRSSFSYLVPYQWEESIAFSFLRSFHGIGIFNQYQGADASNGIALELKRSHLSKGTFESMTKGYVHFSCASLPNKLSGRYKFKGTSANGFFDTLRIVVQLGSLTDTISLQHLNLDRSIPSQQAVTYNITKDTAAFKNFEIDLSSLAGIKVEEVAIHFILMSAGAPISVDSSVAVIDDLHLHYNTVGIGNQQLNESSRIYPNPTTDLVYIQRPMSLKPLNVVVYDAKGKRVLQDSFNANEPKHLDLSTQSKGLYFIRLEQENMQVEVHRLIKN
jgi:hypothetical protein